MKTRNLDSALEAFREKGGTLRTRDLIALGVHTGSVTFAMRCVSVTGSELSDVDRFARFAVRPSILSSAENPASEFSQSDQYESRAESEQERLGVVLLKAPAEHKAEQGAVGGPHDAGEHDEAGEAGEP